MCSDLHRHTNGRDFIRIDNLPATDAAGYAGLSDKVDCHMRRLLKRVVL